jgi:hypothetical protein
VLVTNAAGRAFASLSREDARHLVDAYVEHYNNVGLNSAIGYKDMHQQEILAERDRKLEAKNRRRRAA